MTTPEQTGQPEVPDGQAAAAVKVHVHMPAMAVVTCECGARGVILDGEHMEGFDHNWAALDRFFAKKATVQ